MIADFPCVRQGITDEITDAVKAFVLFAADGLAVGVEAAGVAGL